MRRRGAPLVLLGALALVSVNRAALAQSPSEVNLAKQTAGEGLAAYNAGEFDKALGLFNQAKKIYPSAQILRMIGYSELALEHWLKALESLEGALDAKITPLAKEDRKDVEDQIAKAMAHIGTVTVSCKVAGAKLSVDGAEPQPCQPEKPLRLLEGQHKLLATATERIDAPRDLKVEGGKTVEVTLEPAEKPKPLPPPPPPPPPPKPKGLFPHQREVGFAAVGGGVAFGAAALVTVIEAAHWRSIANADVNKHLGFYGPGCAMGDPRLCAYDITVTNQESSTANQLRNAAAGLGVTAAALGAAGVVFIVTAPKAQRAPVGSAPPAPPPLHAVSVQCGAGGGVRVACSGTF
jgi:hypothetical protein